jgi:hypothetical protein
MFVRAVIGAQSALKVGQLATNVNMDGRESTQVTRKSQAANA